MILFHFPSHETMAQQLLPLCPFQGGRFAVNRFPNQELYITISGPVSGEHCLILGSITPPDEQLFSVMLLAHTLKKEGARKVTALLPYLAYSRHDKDKPGESLTVAWVGSLFQSSGIDEVITVDLHSQRDREFFPVSVTSIPTTKLFAEAIQKHGLKDATLVAPDNGAINRCRDVKAAANMPGELVTFEKQRTLHGITHLASKGAVGPRAVVIDDMLDTGGTLISACEELARQGAMEIYIMVTHGLFTGPHWKKLLSLRVKTLFCTDTIALRKELASEPIVTLSVIPLLQTQLQEAAGYDQGTH